MGTAIPVIPGQVPEWLSIAPGGDTEPSGDVTPAPQEEEKIRIESLTDTVLATGTVVEAVGNPVYVSDVAEYAEYNLEQTGWYVFARIAAKGGVTVSEDTVVTGAAGHVAAIGADHVDVAVRFDVAAVSQVVTVSWAEGVSDSVVFKATDLAVRNLDYRVTFYVYDIADFATWEYGFTTDTAVAEGKNYYVKDSGGYVKADVVVGDPISAYYIHTWRYALTADTTFQDGTDYYTLEGDVYIKAAVTVGEAIPAGTYYVPAETYEQAEGTFEEGTTYYVKDDNAYTEAAVTVGEAIPALYVHTKVRFEGMARNITYRCNTIIDCPVEFVLPEIEDDCHGAWFEIRFRHAGSYSSTLIPPSGDVKIATEHTQSETAGLNMVNLHYSSIGGAKVWRFMNTHSNFTATAPALVSIAFRGIPKTAYAAGEALDLTGAEVVATYEDGTRKLVTTGCTFTPASGTALTAADTALSVSYTEGDVTVTASLALAVS